MSSSTPTSANTIAQAADALMAGLPQFQAQAGGIIVIKYGGSLMRDKLSGQSKHYEDDILGNIAWLKAAGYKPIIVHGGGPAINDALVSFNREPQFINGLRVTDEDTLSVVEMVLSGQINKTIVGRLEKFGCTAMGLSGRDAQLIHAEKKLKDGIDLGRVGTVKTVNTFRFQLLLDHGITPVISPICSDGEGGAFNVNADEVAVAIAVALKAQQFLLLTDVPGVLADVSDPTSLLSELTVSTAQQAMLDGVITGGMIPKIQSVVDSIQQGVGMVRILDGRAPHALLSALVLNGPGGTRIQPDHDL
jgi:acetylglutamate kinase